MALTNEIGSSDSFTYTGTVIEITIPITGVYKLECYGGKGGNAGGYTNKKGANGGYASCHVVLKKGSTLYACVGRNGPTGSGSSWGGTIKSAAAYNGGASGSGSRGDGGTLFYGSGGGATHFATVNGVLADLSADLDAILCVAGGGGGSQEYAYGNSTGGTAGKAYQNVTTYNNGVIGKGSSNCGGGGYYGGKAYYGGTNYVVNDSLVVSDVTYASTSTAAASSTPKAVITLVAKIGASIYKGSLGINTIYLGDKEVTAICLGDKAI